MVDRVKDNYIGFKAWDMGFDAHLTVLYTGIMDDETRAKAEEFIGRLGPINTYARRHSLAIFGPEHKPVPVLRVSVDPKLRELREDLISLGLPNPSVFQDWNPHITLKVNGDTDTIHLPRLIKLTDFGVH